MGRPFLFDPGDNRKQQLFIAASQAGLSAAELLRRMMDHCLTPVGLGTVVPCLSGQFHTTQGG